MDRELLRVFNGVYSAARAGRAMSDAEKFGVFRAFLNYEQRARVEALVHETADLMGNGLARALFQRPVVRFPFFSAGKFLFFGDFVSMPERIEKAEQVAKLAAKRGWPRVEATLRAYGTLPRKFFDDPLGFTNALKARLTVGDSVTPPFEYTAGNAAENLCVGSYRTL